ncbi:MAG: Gp15 family bacteriophage protein [Spirochaetales bacterium]|nr:Gp15 family bacteriophage protein [Spirochaetales bacterium]MDY5914609.1 Gp15 family bacteriophage protein [Treponema sp.]
MIDLSKTIDLPDSITVLGKSYRIHTDYQFFITFVLMAKKPHTYEEYNFMYEGKIPADVVKGFEELKNFAFPKKELPRDIGNDTDEIILDYEKDGDLIYSAFWQCYGIDLKAEDLHLHWYKFLALLSGIKDTKLNKVMEFRSYIPKEEDGKEYRKYMLQMREMWRIEKELTDEEKEAIFNFDSQLK